MELGFVATRYDAHTLTELMAHPLLSPSRRYVGLVKAALDTDALRERVKLVAFAPCNTNYLSIADLHLSASTHEAYPLNTMEAMAKAVPVVASVTSLSLMRIERISLFVELPNTNVDAE